MRSVSGMYIIWPCKLEGDKIELVECTASAITIIIKLSFMLQAASRIKFYAQFQFQSQWRRLCVSGHFVYSFHYAAIVRVSLYIYMCVYVCICVCAVTYWNQCRARPQDKNRNESNTEHDRETTKLIHLQSQKTLLVAATHGALPRLEHIDGVYVRQDVLECELQVWSYRLHHLYQRAVLLGHSAEREREKEKRD